ncbi:hypothetical protein [Thalassobellus citreus]|uniref:hypothetical protein n=1 Tax=Thalassobellus citreus TaxID=3367752 RepID=UPI0037922981
MPKKLLLISLFCFIHYTEAQVFMNQGEGRLIVEQFLSLTETPNFNTPYQTYTFYIKNFKVLRKNSLQDANLIQSNSSSSKKDNYTLKNNLSARVLAPTYILDLKKQEAIVFGFKNDTTYYYKTELKDFLFSIYRMFFNGYINKQQDDKKMKTLNKHKEIAKNLCEEFLFPFSAKESGKNIDAHLWITKNRTPVKTPLDNMFKAPKFSIFSATFPLDKNKNGLSGFITYRVKEMKKQETPDSLFQIPKGAILLTREEFEKRYLYREN